MDVKELLPIGSVVRLGKGTKKLMIEGIKQTEARTDKIYDYIAVSYPIGCIDGSEGKILFNHEKIYEILFRGYEDKEREEFIDKLDKFFKENPELG